MASCTLLLLAAFFVEIFEIVCTYHHVHDAYIWLGAYFGYLIVVVSINTRVRAYKKTLREVLLLVAGMHAS